MDIIEIKEKINNYDGCNVVVLTTSGETVVGHLEILPHNGVIERTLSIGMYGRKVKVSEVAEIREV